MNATKLTEDAKNAANVPGEQSVIEAWHAEQLRCLGLPRALAEAFAGLVDWHDVASLVGHGCPPELALEIAR